MALPETYPVDPFPFDSQLSFRPVIAYWNEELGSDDPVRSGIARHVLDAVGAVPELLTDEVEPDEARRFRRQVRSLLSAVYPPTTWDTGLLAGFAPFRLDTIVSSKGFEALDPFSVFLSGSTAGLRTHGGAVSVVQLLDRRSMLAYFIVLKRFYGIDVQSNVHFMFDRVIPDSGLTRFFRFEIDPRFVEVQLTGELPTLSGDDVRALLARPDDLPFWMEKLPPDAFRFRGIGTMMAVDVTIDESISRIKQSLLSKNALLSPHVAETLQRYVRSHLNLPDLRLGVIALDRCDSGEVGGARAMGRSILLEKGLPACTQPQNSIYFDVIDQAKAAVFEDLEEVDRNTGFEYRLSEEGVRNLFLAPLMDGQTVVGVLEVGSPNVGDLNNLNAGPLRELTAIFGTALRRSLEEQEDRVQALIKRQYTAIHPVVEWRFRKAALEYMTALEENRETEWASIRFDNVIPLYGMSDIRRSSVHRAQAVQADLVEQLGLAMAVIIVASTVRPRPSLDELGFRLSNHIEHVQSGLASGDESALLTLLREEVEPLFEEFKTYSDDVARHVARYVESLDPDLGIVYSERKKYEQSVTILNDTISSHLEAQEDAAQEMVPHYFERFRTDGVDYNIYTGASIVEYGRFSDLDLRNLRLWQLTTTAGIAGAVRRVCSELPVQLEVAHLILVHSEPLSIRFREDEKKFDVDGAYNIRYEIVKKRIDKALVAGSTERITQPGHIAIVYSQDRERDEYVRHLEYLTAAGYFAGEVEHLLLEDLPGASGLRAIRVRVAETSPGEPYLSIPDPSDQRSIKEGFSH